MQRRRWDPECWGETRRPSPALSAPLDDPAFERGVEASRASPRSARAVDERELAALAVASPPLADNGSCYRSKEFNKLLFSEGTVHTFIRPYRPQPNGKAERLNRTLAKIPPGGGWRVHGFENRRKLQKPRGYAYVPSAIDAHTRLAYSEIHANEQAITAIGFWQRVRAFFASYGITIERLIEARSNRAALRGRSCAGEVRSERLASYGVDMLTQFHPAWAAMHLRLLIAFVLAAAILISVSASQARADPPPLGPCPTSVDPSGTCPPNETQYINAYTWVYSGNHGGTSVDFGTSMPNSFSAFQTSCMTDPNSSSYFGDYSVCSVPSPNKDPMKAPNSRQAWFSSNQVTVSSGELHLGTSWNSSIQDCKDYWGYVVGIDGGPGHPASGCWVSGTVEQVKSVWPWPSGSTEHFAFDAKWIGTNDIPDLESTFQASSTFPPEVDVVDTNTPGSGFNIFVHCAPSNSQDQVSTTSFVPTSWHVYEFDLTSTFVYVYVDGTQVMKLARSDSNCTGGAGQTDSDWLPYAANGSNSLGAYMEAVMGTNGLFPDSSWHTSNQTILVDWVAEN